MKSGNLLSLLSTLILVFAGLSTAWPWPALFGGSNGLLVARQDQSSSVQASASQTGSSTVSPTGSSSNSVTGSNSASNTASITGSASGSGSATRSGSGTITTGSGTRTGNKTSVAINPVDPPGGISMITPGPFDGTTYIKVGDQVTFKWNYTSLSVAPSYIDVIATNRVNSQTYTIAANESWQSTQAITWDTGDYSATASIPFVVAMYTLMVYDANSNPSAIPSAGYLGAFANLQFGIYTPQPYTPLNDFRCATCNGAMSLHEKQALSVLIGTCVITVFSFTWFAAGFGAFA